MKRLLPAVVLTFTAGASCGLDLAGLPGAGTGPGSGGGSATTSSLAGPGGGTATASSSDGAGGGPTTTASVTASASSSSSGTGGGGPVWTRRRKLELDSGQNVSITGIPILVLLKSDRIDYGQTQNQGQDLRFIDDQGKVLPHEIERWDEGNTSLVWVRVPTVNQTGTDLTSIFMYYGNADATDGQDVPGVWSSGYRGVWHLAESGDSLTDSSGKTADAKNYGSTQSNGMVGKGRSFNAGSNQYIDTLNSVDLTQFTVEAWVRGTKAPSTTGGPNGPLMREKNYQFLWDHSDPVFFGTASFKAPSPKDWIASDLAPLSAGTWYYLVATYDGSKLRSYKNGTKQSIEVTAGAPLAETDSAKIGRHAHGTETRHFFDGDIDEVRIAQGAHSERWVAAQYKSMMDSGFVKFGPEETPGPWPLP
jgi:hypothetical protein